MQASESNGVLPPTKSTNSKARRRAARYSPLKRRWSAQSDAELQALWQAGINVSSIADKTQRSVCAVVARLKKLDVVPMPLESNPYSFRSWVVGVVYVLGLEHDKKWVGYTTDFPRRIGEHWIASSFPDAGIYVPQWLRLHKPLAVEQFCVGTPDDELKWTLQTMSDVGFENVRSSRFRKLQMTEAPVQLKRFQELQAKEITPCQSVLSDSEKTEGHATL